MASIWAYYGQNRFSGSSKHELRRFRHWNVIYIDRLFGTLKFHARICHMRCAITTFIQGRNWRTKWENKFRICIDIAFLLYFLNIGIKFRKWRMNWFWRAQKISTENQKPQYSLYPSLMSHPNPTLFDPSPELETNQSSIHARQGLSNSAATTGKKLYIFKNGLGTKHMIQSSSSWLVYLYL